MFNSNVLSRAGMMTVVCLAFVPAFAHASVLDLSRYSLTATYSAGVGEASGVTYNWDDDTLFIVSDNVVAREVTKSGMSVPGTRQLGTAGSGDNAFKDTEGVTYVGNGQYVITDERTQDVSLITPMQHPFGGPDDFLYSSKPASPTYSFGETVPNIGIEGVSYDPLTGTFFAIKEDSPQAVYQADISFGDSTATTTGSHVELFDPALLGLTTLSDIQVLSTVDAFAGTDFEENLLVLSATSELLLEITRTGEIVSSLSLAGMAEKIEGVTIDNDGVIYLVAESSIPGDTGGSLLVLNAAPVPEPGTALLLLSCLAGLGWHSRRRRQDKPSVPAAA